MSVSPVDVLILTALEPELDAVLEFGDRGRDGWSVPSRRSAFTPYQRIFKNERAEPLRVAVAWIGQMGEAAAAERAASLSIVLDPSCIAMCGICAGHPGKVSLGDVIVADRVINYDAGKLVAATEEAPALSLPEGDFYRLDDAWRGHAAQIAREQCENAALAALRPSTIAAQTRWILHTLDASKDKGGPPPLKHPDREARCPDYSMIVARLLSQPRGPIHIPEGTRDLTLTEEGQLQVIHEKNIDEVIGDPPFRVHLGTLATGKAVVRAPKLFERLEHMSRHVLGVDMEASGVGLAAGASGKRFIVVKAVSDHADHNKDDRFRSFACHASAAVLLAFLKRCVDPKRPDNPGTSGSRRIYPVWFSPTSKPHYPDERTRLFSERLEVVRQRQQVLWKHGGSTDEVDAEIIALRQELREGGLKPGCSVDDDRYLLEKRLGEGHFGVVWRAFDHLEGARVAIKVLRPDRDEPVRRERFFEGAKRMAELQHPAVVRVLDPHGEDENFDFYVMELMEGGDLRSAVIGGRVSAGDMLPIILHIGAALSQAHAAQLIHRDVKPANILLDAASAPKLTDFDIVRGPLETGKTTGGIGTFPYAAPEQLREGRQVTMQADVFGLGMTALCILYGAELPPEVHHEREAFFAALPCADAMKDALKRAVASRQEHRFHSIGALCEALIAATEPSAEAARQLERLFSWSEGADAVRAAIWLSDMYVALSDADNARGAIRRGLSVDAGNAELRRRLRGVLEAGKAWEELADLLVEDAMVASPPEQQRRLYLEAADIRLGKLNDIGAAFDLLFKAAETSSETCAVLPFLRSAVDSLGQSEEILALLRAIVADGVGEGSKQLAALAARLEAKESRPPCQPLWGVPLRLGWPFHHLAREVNFKIVYAGPLNAGVTTNLMYIYERVKPEAKGKIISLATEPRRTLIYDIMPSGIVLADYKIRIHLYTLPFGQDYDASRKLILRNLGGIVFVADSRIDCIEANQESLENLRTNLAEQGYLLDKIPYVIQYNKRDLPEIAPIEELRQLLNPSNVPDFEGAARTGVGVFDTLKSVVKLVRTEYLKLIYSNY